MQKNKNNYHKLRGDEVKSHQAIMKAIEKWFSCEVYNLSFPRCSKNLIEDAEFLERLRAHTAEHDVSFMIVEYSIGESDIKIILQSRPAV